MATQPLWCRALIHVRLIACLATFLIATVAWAGELKFGAQPLDTDDDGKITAEGRKAALTEIPSNPGEEVWPLHIWVEPGKKAAAGPLYFEFFGRLPDGKRYLAMRHAVDDYDGEQYLSATIELEGRSGFNKGHDYEVEVSQRTDKGKDIKLASSKIKLVFVEAPPAAEKSEPQGDTDGEEQTEEQDELDSLAGVDGAEGDGPPPVEQKKRGCTLATSSLEAGLFVVVLMGLGRRRRRL
jgi:hypothetical protein